MIIDSGVQKSVIWLLDFEIELNFYENALERV